MNSFYVFFFNDTATTEIYTLSLHDALPICKHDVKNAVIALPPVEEQKAICKWIDDRSEEHTSELQSPCNLVCRLLLEKKNKSAPSPTFIYALYHHVSCPSDTYSPTTYALPH